MRHSLSSLQRLTNSMVTIDLQILYFYYILFFSYQMTESEKPGIEKHIKPSGLVLETVALTSVCLSNSRTFINIIINVLEALLI